MNASRLQLKQVYRFYNDLLAGKSLTDMVPSPPLQNISEIRWPRKDLLMWLTTPLSAQRLKSSMPEKKHCYHTSGNRSPVCDLNIYSKLWAVDSWPGVCLQIMMWMQMMPFMTMKQSFRRPRPRKEWTMTKNYYTCIVWNGSNWVSRTFQQLLTAVLNSKEIQVFHYEIYRYPTVLFDSPLSCLSLIYPHWLDTCKYSCFRWERMSHMGISHALDRGAML